MALLSSLVYFQVYSWGRLCNIPVLALFEPESELGAVQVVTMIQVAGMVAVLVVKMAVVVVLRMHSRTGNSLMKDGYSSLLGAVLAASHPAAAAAVVAVVAVAAVAAAAAAAAASAAVEEAVVENLRNPLIIQKLLKN
jgi:hypothetical protein